MLTKDIRDSFTSFFEKNGHQTVPSGPLVPQNDPTLMFTNAGMVQFKNVFTGLEQRPYNRAVTAQKCVRAGGKHNDLENVGYTARHHTFFEMLGNFSFGDYFKEEAIVYAWDYLTRVLSLPKDKLYITVYKEDTEAQTIWKKLTGFSDEKIIQIATNDNFWSMGDTGPCGPCTEIFYDHGPSIKGGLPGTPEEDGDRFVEIWNLVFMQYERHLNGTQTALPNQSVDTGMGIERIAAVMQGVSNNYETDILKALVTGVAEKTNTKSAGSALVSQRVIADHLRSACFLIADGVTPSNEGRGYVLRRIMRRAMRHAYKLQAKDPILADLAPILVDKMGDAYGELCRAQDLMALTLRLEEEKFKDAFERGIRVLEDELSQNHGQVFSGVSAFKLYDTYGFPLDLTQDILREKNMSVNTDEFNGAMDAQKKLARASWSGSGGAASETIWFDIKDKVGATEFLGYSAAEADAEILALIKDGQSVESLSEGEVGFMVTNQTPFYGESGGQMGDVGHIKMANLKVDIQNTLKKLDNLIVHEIKVTKGKISLKDPVHLEIDKERRSNLRANHSATHLLHEVLRRKLGHAVAQKGSLVAPDKLRFDFSYHQKITQDMLFEIETEMNAQIRGNAPVVTELSSPDVAIKKGAQALFGEKYGDEVRVVSFGKSSPFSVELCGGTHVHNLGEIGFFKILSESSVSSGVRRIEAVTGREAEFYVQSQLTALQGVADALKTPTTQLEEKVKALLVEKKSLEKKLTAPEKTAHALDKEVALKVADTSVLVCKTNETPSKDLRSLMDALKLKVHSGVVLLESSYEGKGSLLIGVTKDLLDIYDARKILGRVAEHTGIGAGGGRPDLAQTGGVVNKDLVTLVKDGVLLS